MRRTLEDIKNDRAQAYYNTTFKQASAYLPTDMLVDLMDECANILAAEEVAEFIFKLEEDNELRETKIKFNKPTNNGKSINFN